MIVRAILSCIKRFSLLTILIILLASPSWEMEHYTDSLQSETGKAIGGASVTVYNAGTLTKATIYSDNGSTQKSNPFTTNVFDGTFDFYAANNVYDIVFRHPEFSFDDLLTKHISLFDINNFSGDITYGNAFPTDPAINDLFVLTSDSGVGNCIAAGGIEVSLCRFDGANWTGLGGGGSSAQGLGPNFALTNGNIITGVTEIKPLFLYGSGGQSTSGIVMARHSSGYSFWKCVEANVIGDCHVYVDLNTGKKWGVKNHSGTIVLEFDEALGKFTTATIDCSQGGVACSLVDERHFAVATCQNTTASANFDLPTSNAPTATCNTGSNTQKGYLAFNDTTEQSFQDHFILPSGFSSMTVSFRWKSAATSGAVGWCVQFSRVPDGTTSDQAFSSQITANCISDTAKGTTLQENSATITGVTCSGCVGGDHVYVRISRDADGSAVTDDMTGDALLLNYGRSFSVTQ